MVNTATLLMLTLLLAGCGTVQVSANCDRDVETISADSDMTRFRNDYVQCLRNVWEVEDACESKKDLVEDACDDIDVDTRMLCMDEEVRNGHAKASFRSYLCYPKSCNDKDRDDYFKYVEDSYDAVDKIKVKECGGVAGTTIAILVLVGAALLAIVVGFCVRRVRMKKKGSGASAPYGVQA